MEEALSSTAAETGTLRREKGRQAAQTSQVGNHSIPACRLGVSTNRNNFVTDLTLLCVLFGLVSQSSRERKAFSSSGQKHFYHNE